LLLDGIFRQLTKKKPIFTIKIRPSILGLKTGPLISQQAVGPLRSQPRLPMLVKVHELEFSTLPLQVRLSLERTTQLRKDFLARMHTRNVPFELLQLITKSKCTTEPTSFLKRLSLQVPSLSSKELTLSFQVLVLLD